MNQTPLYMQNTYCFNLDTQAIAQGTDEHGEWIALEQNIFHPQGGGQPADTGWVNDIPVKVRKHPSGQVVVYPQEPLQFEQNATLRTAISATERLQNAALHTAGHLMNIVLKPYGWLATSGHHFPRESRVEFSRMGDEAVPVEELPIVEIQKDIHARLRAGAAVTAWMEGETRLTLIENTEPILCGGTHVENISEITDFFLKSAKVKKGTLRISYHAAYSNR
ncbi:hypothetical protein [Rouxiella badensis]|uniref:hypothetical protein n=1 Tax=Rouxiella badensis TaxID=1646377 RepID=UPI003C4F3430